MNDEEVETARHLFCSKNKYQSSRGWYTNEAKPKLMISFHLKYIFEASTFDHSVSSAKMPGIFITTLQIVWIARPLGGMCQLTHCSLETWKPSLWFRCKKVSSFFSPFWCNCLFIYQLHQHDQHCPHHSHHHIRNFTIWSSKIWSPCREPKSRRCIPLT